MHSKTFIHQLHHILMQDGLSEWIRWADDDIGIFIIKPNAPDFSVKVLKRFFKHGNVSSFVRQLHMYGFHKLPQPASTGASTVQESSKSEIEWRFTHHSHDFRKDASEAQLKRIHRKSNNIGKDGKRRNVLSPVCVSYLGPLRDAASEASAAEMSRKTSLPQPLMPQNRRSPLSPAQLQPIQHSQSFSQLQHQIPLTIPSNVPTHMSTSVTPIPPTIPAPIPAPIPSTAASHIGTNPLHSHTIPISSPVPRVSGSSLYSTSPYPSVSYQSGFGQTSFQAHTMYHYEQNLGILIRTMLQMCDALSCADNNVTEHLERIKLLKLELLTTESNWNMLFSHNSGTAGSSTSTATTNRFNSMGSYESQKNSIFSNPRFSKVQKVSLGGTTTQFSGNGSTSGDLDLNYPGHNYNEGRKK